MCLCFAVICRGFCFGLGFLCCNLTELVETKAVRTEPLLNTEWTRIESLSAVPVSCQWNFPILVFQTKRWNRSFKIWWIWTKGKWSNMQRYWWTKAKGKGHATLIQLVQTQGTVFLRRSIHFSDAPEFLRCSTKIDPTTVDLSDAVIISQMLRENVLEWLTYLYHSHQFYILYGMGDSSRWSASD